MAKPVYFGIGISTLKERISKNPAGAYIFYGQEELLKHFYLEKFIKRIEKEGMAEFNLSRLDFSRDATLGALEDELGILPVMGSLRLVICRGLNPIALSASDLDRLCAMIKGIGEETILILYLSSEELVPDKATASKKAVKLLSEIASFCAFPLQEERVLLSWSAKILSADGLSASPQTLKLLISMTGGKMSAMRSELEKLSMYALSQNRSTVTEEDVSLFVQPDQEFAIYQLTGAVLAGSFAATQKMLDFFKKHDGEPIVIVAALSRMFVNALVCTGGAGESDAMLATGMQAWQIQNMKRDCHGKKRQNFETALSLCIEADKRLKGANSDPFSVCETLCLKLCRLCSERAG